MADRRKVEWALTGVTDVPTFRRMPAILRLSEGATIKETAHILNVSPRSVSRWLACYRKRHDIAVLYPSDERGRPLSALKITAPRILQELEHNPMNVGYASNVWTVDMLAHRLSKKYHCTIKPRTLRRRIKEAGLVWKRPRYVYHERAEYIGAKKGLNPPYQAVS